MYADVVAVNYFLEKKARPGPGGHQPAQIRWLWVGAAGRSFFGALFRERTCDGEEKARELADPWVDERQHT